MISGSDPNPPVSIISPVNWSSKVFQMNNPMTITSYEQGKYLLHGNLFLHNFGEIWWWHPVKSCHKYHSLENVPSVTLEEINGGLGGRKWIWLCCWLIDKKILVGKENEFGKIFTYSISGPGCTIVRLSDLAQEIVRDLNQIG